MTAIGQVVSFFLPPPTLIQAIVLSLSGRCSSLAHVGINLAILVLGTQGSNHLSHPPTLSFFLFFLKHNFFGLKESGSIDW